MKKADKITLLSQQLDSEIKQFVSPLGKLDLMDLDPESWVSFFEGINISEEENLLQLSCRCHNPQKHFATLEKLLTHTLHVRNGLGNRKRWICIKSRSA